MNARRKKLAGVIAFVFVIALLAWRLLPSPEPVYNGKTLSAWAQQYGSNNWRGGGRPAAEEAEVAIRQIGTNGIPFLLDLIRVRDSAPKKKLRTFVPRSWHDRLQLGDTSGEIRRIGAHGLAALGTNAPAAVPALIEIATHHPDEDGRYIAVFALRTLGVTAESAIPFFIRCLTNDVNIIRDEAAIGLGGMQHRPDIVVPNLIQYLKFAKSSISTFECTDAIASLGKFGTNAKAAVPILIELLDHADASVRMEVTNRLPHIDPERLDGMRLGPETVVSNLIEYLEFARMLNDTFWYKDTIAVLGSFGTKAKAAVPIMVNLLNDPDPSVRAAVTNWLPRIDAAAAAKAQIKSPR